MGESEEKGAMQAENPFAMLQVHSRTQSCGMKSDSSGKSPLLKASRAGQEGAAASAVKSMCKATISMGTDCRGQI